jgi:hypothetical protein
MKQSFTNKKNPDAENNVTLFDTGLIQPRGFVEYVTWVLLR